MKLFTFILPLTIILSTFNVHANMIKELKQAEASKFDVGMLRLDIIVLIVNDKFYGERIKNTEFEFGKASTFSNNEQLGLNMSFISDSENLTPSSCETMKLYTAKIFDKQTLTEAFSYDFKNNEKAELINRIHLNTILVDEDNSNMTFKCQ